MLFALMSVCLLAVAFAAAFAYARAMEELFGKAVNVGPGKPASGRLGWPAESDSRRLVAT